MTKLYTATVVLQLAAEEKVELDEPLATLQATRVPDGVTVRQLLQMTSGIPDYHPALVGDRPDLSRFTRSHDAESLIRLGIDRGCAPPGVRFEYSNTNYLILGLLIEAIERAQLAEVIDRRLSQPLGLRRTSLPTSMDLSQSTSARLRLTVAR